MSRKGRVGWQMYKILLLTLIIPIGIIGIVSAMLLFRQMNDRYEEQVKAENTRVKSILFDVTSSIYTNLEPIVSVQEYRDMFSSDIFGLNEEYRYNELDRSITSLKRSTAAISPSPLLPLRKQYRPYTSAISAL